MDWGRVRDTPREAPTPAYDDRPVWAATKGERRAEMRLRAHPLGLEARCTVGGELFHAIVFRPHEAAEMRVHCTGVRQDFERFGWTLIG